MDLTTQQVIALVLMLLCLIGIAITVWRNDFNNNEQKKTIRAFYKNRLEWTWYKNQEHEEKETTKEK